MEPVIIDNFLPEMYVDSIYKLMGGHEILWSFSKYSTSSDPNLEHLFYTDEETEEHLQFRHIFIENNSIKSPHLQHISPLIACYENQFGKIKSTQRIKSNLLVPQKGPALQRPHADDMEYSSFDSTGYIANRKTLLYYVNGSDGETIIYNEKYEGKPVGKLTVKQRITPVKGRAVIFDSNQIHSASLPVEKRYRLVINCVFQ
jgi:hypothetical protein